MDQETIVHRMALLRHLRPAALRQAESEQEETAPLQREALAVKSHMMEWLERKPSRPQSARRIEPSENVPMSARPHSARVVDEAVAGLTLASHRSPRLYARTAN